jgi:hypothetical protein
MYRVLPINLSGADPPSSAARRVLSPSERRALVRPGVVADQLASALLDHAHALVRVHLARSGSREHREALDEKLRFGRRVAELESQLLESF